VKTASTSRAIRALGATTGPGISVSWANITPSSLPAGGASQVLPAVSAQQMTGPVLLPQSQTIVSSAPSGDASMPAPAAVQADALSSAGPAPSASPPDNTWLWILAAAAAVVLLS